tara:strand:+ start:189 stop:587 length:399 start_codon:yes stop_codon:yes gene_type:complete
MNTIYKDDIAYRTIGEVAKELGLVDNKTGNLQTHTIRYWETQFKQLKPSIGAGNRRYYSNKNFELIKSIMYLLKEKGFTINGVKKILNNPEISSIDADGGKGILKHDIKKTNEIKNRLKKISKLVNELKKIK